MIGLYFDNKYIRAVELKESPQGITLTRFAFIEATEVNPLALSQLLSEQKFEGKEVYSVITGPKVQIRSIALPPMPEDELTEAVKWEAKNVFPFPLETAAVDYYPLEKGKGVKQNILVIAVEGEALAKHVSLIEQAGFKCSGVTVIPFALLELTRIYPALLGVELTALVDLDIEFSSFNLFKRGTLVFTRELSVSGIDITKPSLERLQSEIRSSLDYYRQLSFEEKTPPLFVLGGISYLTSLKDFLAENLGTPVEAIDPLKNLQIDPKVDQGRLRSAASGLAIPIGLALGRGRGLNLLTIKERKKKTGVNLARVLDYIQIPNTAIIGTLVTLIVFLIIFNFYLNRSIEDTKKELDIRSLRLNQLIKFRDRKIAFEDIEKKELNVQETIARVNSLMPGGLSLVYLNLNGETREIELGGESSDPELASRFLNAVEDSPYFGQARLIEIKKEGAAITFRITFKIS